LTAYHKDSRPKDSRRSVCHDPLVSWKGPGLLLGGHHRLPLCLAHHIPFTVVELELPSREAAKRWIILDQLGKRNVTPEWSSYWRGELYNAAKGPHGGDRKGAGSSAQREHLKSTAQELAEQCKSSPATVRRDGRYAAALDRVAEACGDQVKRQILAGQAGLSRQEVVELAKEEDPEALKEAVQKRLGQKGKAGAKQPPSQDKDKNKGKGKQSGAAGPQTITLPVQPSALAQALVERRGRRQAAAVHRALGALLEGNVAAQPKGQPPRSARGGRKS
jgi:hypothetical protein